jgi:putative glutamine amidotransferase
MWHPELPVEDTGDLADPLISAFVAAAGGER